MSSQDIHHHSGITSLPDKLAGRVLAAVNEPMTLRAEEHEIAYFRAKHDHGKRHDVVDDKLALLLATSWLRATPLARSPIAPPDGDHR